MVADEERDGHGRPGGPVALRRDLTRQRWAVAVACLAVAGVAVVDLLAPPEAVFIGMVSLGPLLASLAASTRQTFVVSVAAAAIALVLGIADGIFLTVDHLIRLSIVVLVGAVSTYAASQRTKRSEATARLARVAEVAQGVMLRPPPRRLAHVALAARYMAASDESVVGGDLYETAFTPTGVRVIIGDVRGKGLDAVRLAATVLATFREVMWEQDLLDLVRAMDERVAKEADDEDFVTAMVVELPAEGGVRVVNCGHHPPLRLVGGALQPLETSRVTPPLGLGADPSVDAFDFEVGDRLLLFTDGLVEARDAAGRFFPLADHADVLGLPDLQEAVDGLVLRLIDHVPGTIADDLALVLAERRE